MTDITKPLACIVCGVQPEPVPMTAIQPYEATQFFSHGQYGSTVFDPIDGSELDINVCDKCLHVASVLGRVAHISPQKKYTLWTSDL